MREARACVLLCGVDHSLTLAELRDLRARVDAAIASIPASEDCPGEGICHGPMAWCDFCGDVQEVCDAIEGQCDCHARCGYCGRKHGIDYECEESKRGLEQSEE